MSAHNFPLPFKEYNAVLKAIPSGLIQLIKCHLGYSKSYTKEPDLSLNGISVFNKKCNNKYIRQILQEKKYNVPRGKFYWASLIESIDWKDAWLLPHKYCISNKIKEIHFKILHKIYPVNDTLAKYTDVDNSCSFCGIEDETLIHLFFQCIKTQNFWNSLLFYMGKHLDSSSPFQLKDIICYYKGKTSVSVNYIVNFFILFGKFFIHKQKFAKSMPSFSHFLLEIDAFLNSLRLIKNKKSDRFLKYYDDCFGNTNDV
jgi:hypothetical protein